MWSRLSASISNEKFTAHRYPFGHLIGFSIIARSSSLVEFMRCATPVQRFGAAMAARLHGITSFEKAAEAIALYLDPTQPQPERRHSWHRGQAERGDLGRAAVPSIPLGHLRLHALLRRGQSPEGATPVAGQGAAIRPHPLPVGVDVAYNALGSVKDV